MELNFSNVKKKLEEEFYWLEKNFPTERFDQVSTHIYDFKDYNKTHKSEDEFSYGDNEVNAYLFHHVNDKKLELAILMVLNSAYELTEWDRIILDKGSIKDEHLFYFMLYHEYGHLIQMHDTYKRFGISGFIQILEEMAEETEKIDTTAKKELYRELWFEREADEFAYKIYELRKEKL